MLQFFYEHIKKIKRLQSCFITLPAICFFSVECQQKENSFLEVISEPRILAPSEKLETEIFFYPRELKRYHAKIPFEMNGLSKRFIDITGQGTEMKV